MDIRKKIILIVTASILLTTVPGAALIYSYAKSNLLAHKSTQLVANTAGLANLAMQRFSQGAPKLAALAHILEKQLAQPVKPGELVAFHDVMERNPDGIWRNRKPGFDGKSEAGVFLPSGSGLSDAQKVQHLRIKRTLDVFGAAATKPLENVWYLSLQRSEIIFDRAYPDFAFEQKADNDYTSTPWVTYTSPKLNPRREFRFTPPLFDPVPKVWMVSGLYPLYVNGQWLGSLGQDMPLTSVLEAMFSGETNPGTQTFLQDRQGNFMLAGPWQKQLESTPEVFRLDAVQEPQLTALLQSPLTITSRLLSDAVQVQGKRYLAVGMQLEPLGWSYFRLVPVSDIMAPNRQMFLSILVMILLITVLTGLMISMALGRSITHRIQMLRGVMKGFASDHRLRVPEQGLGDDEIAEVARVYNDMAQDIEHHAEQRLQVQAELSKSEELWRFALEGAGAGVWDWNVTGNTVFFSIHCKEMLGFTADEISSAPQEWVARIHPDDKPAALIAMQDCLRGKTPVYVNEHRILNKNGRYQWMLDRARVVSRSEDGKPLRMIGIHTDITERKLTETAIAESRNLLMTIIDTSPMRVFWKDLELRYLGCNTVFAKDAGMSHPKNVIGQDDYQMVWAEQAELYRADDRAVISSGVSKLFFDEPQTTPSGQVSWIRTSKVPLKNQHKETIGVLGIYEDITQHKLAENNLRLSASVFTHAREGIMITSADGAIINVNDAFTRITGYGRDEVLGQNPRMFSSGRQGKDYYSAMWSSLITHGYWYGEVWNRRKSGEVYAAMQTISAVRDAQNDIRQYVALFSDITAIKEHERQLEHIAHYDALTSLPNRVLLADRLHQAMAQAQRRGQLLAVAYLDLDGFKAINDHHGHEAGDQLLIAVASRMKQALREGDTLARIGGDEFVAVLIDLVDMADSVPMLTRLLAAAAQPVPLGDITLQVSASLGVTFYPQTEEVEADLLLRQSDQAMYQAKLAGKNRYHIFDAEQDRSVRGHHESVERIRHALIEREFVLHYQAKVNMRTGQVVGAEALIRWQHPQRGLLAPAQFLPVIEDHPLAIDIGEWVIDTALTQIEQWDAAGLDIPVSVNVGARQLQQANFMERLREILALHPQIKPASLELEVLETSALEDVASVSRVIEACREIGVMFALDDFGTGYSSLTYLKRLPVALLKIDQSFVRDMLDDPDDLAILEGVIGLARAFRRQVIAEGVETVAHGTLLLQLGCELAQGYGIARPMPAHEMPDWVAAWRTDASWVDLRCLLID